jgi:hypothetical protein
VDSQRLATMVRRLGYTQTRRGTLAGALLSLTVPALALRGGEVQAKSKHKGKKKCRPKQTPEPTPELSCQEACPENCDSCLHRKADSILCGSGFSAGLTSCSTDSDCVGVKFGDIALPYCVTQTESRASGDIDDVGDGKGVCTSVTACVAG